MNKTLKIFLALAVLLQGAAAYAQKKTFVREYTYQASEDDSRNSARANATAQMRSLLLREVGELVLSKKTLQRRSVLVGGSESLSEDFTSKVEAISAGIVEMKTLEERWDGATYYIKAQMTVDPKDLERRIAEVLNDKQKTKKLEESRRRTLAAWQGFSGFQVHAGVSLPVGSFASDKENKTPAEGHGHAATGFTLGAKYYAPLPYVGGLSVAIGLDGFYHGLQHGYMEDYVDVVEKSGGNVAMPKYINVPLTAGLSYAYALIDNLYLYAEAGLGVNFSKITSFVTELEKTSVEASVESRDYGYGPSSISAAIHNYRMEESDKAAFGFAYGVEAGMLLYKRVSIGLRYSNLGSYKYRYTIKESGECRSVNFGGGDDVSFNDLMSSPSPSPSPDGWKVKIGDIYVDAEGGYANSEDGRSKKNLSISNFSIVVGIAF